MKVNKTVNILGEEYDVYYASFSHYKGRSRAKLTIRKDEKVYIELALLRVGVFIVLMNGQRYRSWSVSDAKIKIIKYFTNV